MTLLLGLYNAPLMSVLLGHDVPLSDTHPRDQLLALGFVEWKTAAGPTWVHNEGDDVGYRILCGDISFETARAAQAHRCPGQQSVQQHR